MNCVYLILFVVAVLALLGAYYIFSPGPESLEEQEGSPEHSHSGEPSRSGEPSHSDEPVKEKFRLRLSSYADENDEKTPYLFDKKVTDLWFKIMKEYEHENKFSFNHFTTCRPTDYSSPGKPSHFLHITGHCLDNKISKNYKGDYTESSIRDFINDFVYQNSKKYRIEIYSCSRATKDYKDYAHVSKYYRDREVMDLWYEIIKDYKSHPDVNFQEHFRVCLCSDKVITPSQYLGIKIFNEHLPSQKESLIKEYSGDFSEQSIRDFIDDILYQDKKKYKIEINSCSGSLIEPQIMTKI